MAYSTVLLLREAVAPKDWVADPSPDPQNPTNTCADLTDAQLQDAIVEADAFIDSYIGRYYAVPVVPVSPAVLPPHPIDYWSRNIAAYNATLVYRQSQDFSDQDPIARRYAATLLQLTAVRDGKANLQLLDTSSTNAAVGAGRPVNPYVGDLFGMEDWSLAPVGSSYSSPGHNTPYYPLDGRW